MISIVPDKPRDENSTFFPLNLLLSNLDFLSVTKSSKFGESDFLNDLIISI